MITRVMNKYNINCRHPCRWLSVASGSYNKTRFKRGFPAKSSFGCDFCKYRLRIFIKYDTKPHKSRRTTPNMFIAITLHYKCE